MRTLGGAKVRLWLRPRRHAGGSRDGATEERGRAHAPRFGKRRQRASRQPPQGLQARLPGGPDRGPHRDGEPEYRSGSHWFPEARSHALRLPDSPKEEHTAQNLSEPNRGSESSFGGRADRDHTEPQPHGEPPAPPRFPSTPGPASSRGHLHDAG